MSGGDWLGEGGGSKVSLGLKWTLYYQLRKGLKRGRSREQLPGFCLGHGGHAGTLHALKDRLADPKGGWRQACFGRCSPRPRGRPSTRSAAGTDPWRAITHRGVGTGTCPAGRVFSHPEHTITTGKQPHPSQRKTNDMNSTSLLCLFKLTVH